MESKYGRLFTEKDVLGMLREMRDAGVSLADPETVLRLNMLSPTFPADEPLFLLRGQDAAAAGTIGFYVDECERAGADAPHLNAASHAGGALLAWQAQHPDRVKVPD